MEKLAAEPAAGEEHKLRTPRLPRSSFTCDLMSSAQCRGQGGRESWGESRLPFDATRPFVKGDINKFGKFINKCGKFGKFINKFGKFGDFGKFGNLGNLEI